MKRIFVQHFVDCIEKISCLTFRDIQFYLISRPLLHKYGVHNHKSFTYVACF